MKTHVSLSVKILVLAFLNVLLLGLVFVLFLRAQYRFDLSTVLLSPGRDRILATSRLIALQMADLDRTRWNPLLAQYATPAHVSACLFTNQGEQLAGPPVALPAAVMDEIQRDHGPRWEPEGSQARAGGQPSVSSVHGPPPAPLFVVRTGKPTRYWVGARVPVHADGDTRPGHGTLVWIASSFWTNPFFFDYKPWLVVALAVILVSVICWLPLIRGLTQAISEITSATGQIAQGRLETRLELRRRDELGSLSEAINRMAERLAGFVHGQRRFLSDVAHELCSPIARIQVSLGILEQRAQDNQKKYVEGLGEEVELMSNLVNELLLFSRTQINAAETPLTAVNVHDTVKRVLEREASGSTPIETHVGERLEVMARPEYLTRSLANVVRNALRYAGDAGPIVVSATERDGTVSIRVADSGPGIPEAELENVFKPFYRPELARQRETGGVGLGLAIVRTCIQACGGTVQCRNRSPKGLEVEIRLSIAKP